jgi:hypothetical protein
MRITLLLLVLSGGVLYAGDTNAPPRNIEVTVTGWSPLQTFYIERNTLTTNEAQQVWLVSSKNPKERQLLYTHSRSVEVLISEDEHWLVINDYAGSNLANVLLFRQQHGLQYKQVEDLTDKAWEFVAARAGHKKRLPLDHTYAEALRWTDNHTILLCLHEHLDSRNHVDDWLCLYDVTSKTFSTDLDKHNKQHTTLEAE